MVALVSAVSVASLASCSSDGSVPNHSRPPSNGGAVTSDGPRPGSNQKQGVKVDDRGRALDPLTLTLVLGIRSRDAIPSRIRVENNSGAWVADPTCRIANYRWGVVPVTDPDKALSRMRMTRCGNTRGIPAGFVRTFVGPTFSLTEGPSFGLHSLEPGDYLATIDFGHARSERLTARFTVDVVLTGG